MVRRPVKISIALALVAIPMHFVPVVGAVRYPIDVQEQMIYCQTVEDPTKPYFCDPDAVRQNVAEREGTW